MPPVRRISPVLLALTVAAVTAAVTAVPAAPAPPAQSGDPCAAIANDSVQCGPGNGRQTVGGGEKVSHRGWPRITGVLAKVLDSTEPIEQAWAVAGEPAVTVPGHPLAFAVRSAWERELAEVLGREHA